MSQTVKSLKKIASSDEYRALEAAIKELNPESILASYAKVTGFLEAAQKEVLGKIQELPRQNRALDEQKFRSAFAARSQTILPHWHWVNSELQKEKIMEGKVFGASSKGDPLVRTPEGRVVVVTGAALKEGDNVRFKVVTEGEKLSFGRVFELNPETFYFILTRDAREKVVSSLNAINERIERARQAGKIDISELSALLKELEDTRELASKLHGDERDRIIARISVQRGKLLREYVPKLALDLLSGREEMEIEESCRGDQQQIARAMSAPAIFRRQAHQSLKAEIMDGETPRGYADMVDKLEKNLDSMKAALEVLDFKAEMEKSYPAAKTYLERMDAFFSRFYSRATEAAVKLAGDTACADKIQSSIDEAGSLETAGAELRRVFRTPEEFANLRTALVELMTKLGKAESAEAEAAAKPYVRRVMSAAFRVKG